MKNNTQKIAIITLLVILIGTICLYLSNNNIGQIAGVDKARNRTNGSRSARNIHNNSRRIKSI